MDGETEEIAKIFRGTLNGKAKYCRILIRRKQTPFDNVKPCAKCGKTPTIRHGAGSHKIICHECLFYMEGIDAEALVKEWNSMKP